MKSLGARAYTVPEMFARKTEQPALALSREQYNGTYKCGCYCGDGVVGKEIEFVEKKISQYFLSNSIGKIHLKNFQSLNNISK